MKKILIAILVLTFAVSCSNEDNTGINGGKQLTKWDGVTATEPKLENVTTYLIENGEHLYWISTNSVDKSFNNYTFKLMNDIDLNSNSFTPISTNSSFRFCGTFDGNNKKIMNVIIGSGKNDDLNLALIGYAGTNAIIKDLTLANGLVSGNTALGGIVAYTYGVDYGNIKSPVVISNCMNYLDIKSKDPSSSYSAVGGIVGRIGSGTKLIQSTNYGSIVYDSSDTYVGGVFGSAAGAATGNSIVTNCGSIGIKAYGEMGARLEVWDGDTKIYPNP